MQNLNEKGLEAAAEAIIDNSHIILDSSDAENFASLAIAAYLECVEKWKLFDTHPKDGSYFLITDGEGCCTARWIADIQKEHKYIKTVKAGDIYKTVEVDHGYLEYDSCACLEWPTHWQPLPQPPTTGDSR